MKWYSCFDLSNTSRMLHKMYSLKLGKDHLETIYWAVLHFQPMQTSATDMSYFRKRVCYITFLLIKSHLQWPRHAFLQKPAPVAFPNYRSRISPLQLWREEQWRYQMLLCWGKAQRHQPDLNWVETHIVHTLQIAAHSVPGFQWNLWLFGGGFGKTNGDYSDGPLISPP